MKTTTAIQKSRDKFDKEFVDFQEGVTIIKNPTSADDVRLHITTSQKDILSALIEDMEIIKRKNATRGYATLEQAYDYGHNRGITKVQDIIRKAREV